MVAPLGIVSRGWQGMGQWAGLAYVANIGLIVRLMVAGNQPYRRVGSNLRHLPENEAMSERLGDTGRLDCGRVPAARGSPHD